MKINEYLLCQRTNSKRKSVDECANDEPGHIWLIVGGGAREGTA